MPNMRTAIEFRGLVSVPSPRFGLKGAPIP